MSSGDLCVPERVLRRIFDLINQGRVQYGMYPLTFSKELSFLAGEHACKMSTKKVPYGHDGFEHRAAQAPLALAFSENVACIKPSEDKDHDPGRAIIMSWFNRSSSFSRIQGEYTHTGIGVAESEDGTWYCTQIFATFKAKLSKKDALIVISHFVNQYRKKHGLRPLIVSMSSAANLTRYAAKEPLQGITHAVAKSTFENCYETELIIEKYQKTRVSPLEQFIQIMKESKLHMKSLLMEYTHISFLIQSVSETHNVALLVLAKCQSTTKKISKSYLAYPNACKMLELLNDYRVAKGEKPVILSLQWCEIAQRHSNKMMEKKQEVETRSVSRRIAKMFPTSKAHVGVLVMNTSYDPLQEIFLMWTSNQSIRSMLLSSKFNTFAFGISSLEQKSIFVTRIIGFKEIDESKIAEDAYAQNDREPFVLDGLSSDDDGYDIPLMDAASSFTLTK